MTDERIDALVRRLDVSWEPDPTFVELGLSALTPRVRRARERDQGAIGRFLDQAWRPAVSTLRSPAHRTGLRAAGLLALLIVALLAALLIAGAMRRAPFGNGPLVVSHDGNLVSVDTDSMDVRTTIHDRSAIVGLTRSPDGRLMTFWTGASRDWHLEVANVDGSGRRDLAVGLDRDLNGCIDDWSPDSTRLATEVTDAGTSRILVVEVRTGDATFATRPDTIAHCPLWSPDGRLIAFQRDRADSTSVLAVIAPDGTGQRDVSGDLHGLNDYGANGWSPDAALIYFGAGWGDVAQILRANVATLTSQRLTAVDVQAYAPAVSPDGTQVTFIVPARGWWDLHVMRSDGTGEHRLLEQATNFGWSPDGRYIAAEWHGTSSDAVNGGLVLITPDGSQQRVVLPFDWPCSTNPANGQPHCLDGVSWGEPTP